MLSERLPGSLPGNTKTNPREQVKAVTLRSGRDLHDDKCGETHVAMKETKTTDKGKSAKDDGKSILTEVEVKEPKVTKALTIQPYKTPLSYPARLRKDKDQEHFGKFLNLFKQLHINLPLIEALSQMPRYVKFLKDLLSNKKKLKKISTATIGMGCSAILQNKLLKKLKDPGSFTIPCLIGDLPVEKASAGLGASINLMPYSLFKKLELREPKPTRMSLQLVD